MIVTNQGQDRNKPAATIGFWAALLTAALNVWFFLAFVPNQPILIAPWQGLAAYTASFQPLPFLAWIVPCFFLAPMFLTMMTCLHAWAQKEKQTWSLLALVHAIIKSLRVLWRSHSVNLSGHSERTCGSLYLVVHSLNV